MFKKCRDWLIRSLGGVPKSAHDFTECQKHVFYKECTRLKEKLEETEKLKAKEKQDLESEIRSLALLDLQKLQDECLKMQDECFKLRDENRALREENNELKSKTPCHPTFIYAPPALTPDPVKGYEITC